MLADLTLAQRDLLVEAALRAQDAEIKLRCTIAERPELREVLWPYVERAHTLSNDIADLYEAPWPKPAPTVEPGTILRVDRKGGLWKRRAKYL